jgi:hypothetical protein
MAIRGLLECTGIAVGCLTSKTPPWEYGVTPQTHGVKCHANRSC